MLTATAILLVPLGALCSFIYLLRAISSWRNHYKNGKQSPPGPRPLPIIGNLHMLSNLPHRSLQKLAKKYGPVMSLRLGYVPTVVVSSPQAAEQFLKTHDAIFSSRPKLQASELISYGAKGIAFTEYGPYWRSVRKLCTLELFTTSKVDYYAPMRREELAALVESLKKSAVAREVVDLSNKVTELIEHTTRKMLFGSSTNERFHVQKKNERFDLTSVMQDALHFGGSLNLSDYVPWLAPFDLQGITRSLKETSKKLDDILDGIIDDHEKERSEHETRFKDLTDVMLSLMNKESCIIDRAIIKAIICDVLVGAIETSSTAIQWALSEILRHPRVMKKLQQELESIVGLSKTVEEKDVAKLVYLDMVVKETLRLHPIAPLLVPHESMNDTTVNGFFIPKKSRIIVNAWTIGRDPEVWSDNAEEFYPERFEGSEIDLKGHNFELIPFGSGRRKCPGMQMGLASVRLILAQLVHCFAWELPGELDMTEKFGLSMPRASNLLAMPTYRLHV